MANYRLVVFEVGNTEIAQHRRALKTRPLSHSDHLGSVFFLRQFAGIRHYNGRTRVALRPQLRQEYVAKAVAVHVFDKQHRAAVAGLLELALSQRRHSGVGFGFRQHFILMARRPRPRPHHVDCRDGAGKQGEDHCRLNQYGFT